MKKPLLIFDGDCGFCRKWVIWIKKITGGQVDYAAYQEIGKNFPQIPYEAFTQSIQYILPDGKVFQGAEACALLLAFKWACPLWAYRNLPGVKPLGEGLYRWVARHRGELGFFTPS